jgi:hypothetical protein
MHFLSSDEGALTSEPRTSWAAAFQAALASGSIAGLVSTLALTVCSQVERGRPAAASNGPSQWVWGPAAARQTRASVRYTLVGLVIHQLMSIAWAVLHEKSFGAAGQRKSLPRMVAEGAGTAALAAFVDYRVTPRRFSPGFEHHLCRASLVCVYASFGFGLLVPALLRRAPLRTPERERQRCTPIQSSSSCTRPRLTSSRVPPRSWTA